MSRLAMLKLRAHDISWEVADAKKMLKSKHVSKTTKVMLRNRIAVWNEVLKDIDVKIDAILYPGV